jgi:hypothetical protein
LLALEIEEAQQTESQNLTHAFGSKKPVASMPSVDGEVLQAEDSPEQLQSSGACSPPPQFDSVVKLERVNGHLFKTCPRGKPALSDVQRLPSIWTSKGTDKIGDVLEGYHKFTDMQQIKKPVKPGSSNSARFVDGSVSSRGAADEQQASISTLMTSSTGGKASRSDFWKNMPLAPTTPRVYDRTYELDGSLPPKTPGRLPKYHAYAR